MINRTAFWGSIFGFILLGTGCKEQETVNETPESIVETFIHDLVVQAETVRLWAEAGFESEVIATLSRGVKLKDLEQVSPFTSRIQLAGQTYDEPWIRVQTDQEEKGWIYLRMPDFDLTSDEDPQKWLYEKRLQAYFGATTTRELTDYRTAFKGISTLTDFLNVYREGQRLRVVLEQSLEEKMTRLHVEDLPDMFWLSAVIPGFVPQLSTEGVGYELFTDFRQWHIQAGQTTESDDDSFIGFCMSIFPQDSIEYAFPVWEIQTWDYGGHSLLGRGYHLEALKKMDRLSQDRNIFIPELQQWKQKLIDDITDPETTYWEEQQEVLEELTQIITADFSCLSRDDKIALETRLAQCNDPEKNNVRFNYKSGMY